VPHALPRGRRRRHVVAARGPTLRFSDVAPILRAILASVRLDP
jgi:hypothetical protein